MAKRREESVRLRISLPHEAFATGRLFLRLLRPRIVQRRIHCRSFLRLLQPRTAQRIASATARERELDQVVFDTRADRHRTPGFRRGGRVLRAEAIALLSRPPKPELFQSLVAAAAVDVARVVRPNCEVRYLLSFFQQMPRQTNRYHIRPIHTSKYSRNLCEY